MVADLVGEDGGKLVVGQRQRAPRDQDHMSSPGSRVQAVVVLHEQVEAARVDPGLGPDRVQQALQPLALVLIRLAAAGHQPADPPVDGPDRHQDDGRSRGRTGHQRVAPRMVEQQAQEPERRRHTSDPEQPQQRQGKERQQRHGAGPRPPAHSTVSVSCQLEADAEPSPSAARKRSSASVLNELWITSPP